MGNGRGWNAIKHILWGAETHVHMTCEPNGVGEKEEIKKTHTHTHSIRIVISIRRACGICVASEKCMDDAVEKKKKINAYMNDVWRVRNTPNDIAMTLSVLFAYSIGISHYQTTDVLLNWIFDLSIY